MKYVSLIKSAFNKVLDKTIGIFEMVVLGIIVVSAVSYALAWQAPGGNPPTSNTDTPINTGSSGQAKSGGLLLNSGGGLYGLIVQNGNVGIGTTGPGAKLEIASAGSGTAGTNMDVKLGGQGAFGFRTYNDGSYNYAYVDRNFGGWQTPAMTFRADGNVGIGTASPGQKLEIKNGKLRFNKDFTAYYNTSGPYEWCQARCPSGQGGNDACTCQTNQWQTGSTCTYNSFASGGNNYSDCVYTAKIQAQNITRITDCDIDLNGSFSCSVVQ